MVKNELIKRSPLRILEKSMHGGLGDGNIGVIASKKGVGKTACLVHIATDKLFSSKHVVHVSFSSRTDHIVSWYEDIFKEISKKRDLENAVEVHDEIIKNRVIMNFSQKGMATAVILKSIGVMINDGHFEADTIVIDGYDFEEATSDDMMEIRDFAKANSLEVWFTAQLTDEEAVSSESAVPQCLAAVIDTISVVVTLKVEASHVNLHLVKDHDFEVKDEVHLTLDPKTLLIAEE